MRTLLSVALALSAAVFFAPLSGAEWGREGSDGWPINVDGESTNPFPGVSAQQAATALQGDDPFNQVGGVTIYPYWPILTAEVLRLARDHPDLVRLQIAGKSVLGLDLYMLHICNFNEVDSQPADHGGDSCPGPRGTPREVMWVDGGTHSNEYSGVYFTLAWAQFLVEQYAKNETATWIVQNRDTWIMPMVNPDGSNAMGRLNAHAVNINRNYPVIWDGQGHDATLNNRGPSPASEIETQINIEWYNLTRADYMASVHCCGNLWLYPFGEEGVDPIDEPMLSQVCELAFPDVREACGPIWSTIYPASGSSVDTAYEYSGMVSFGYEMSGRGAVGLWGQPITFETVRTQEYESWNGLEHAFLNVHLYGAYPVVTDVVDDGPWLRITIRNDGLGNLSTAGVEFTYASAAFLEDQLNGVVLPFMAPGESASIMLPKGSVKPQGDNPPVLAVSYVKRLVETSNVGHRLVPLAFVSDGATAAPEGGFLVGEAGLSTEAQAPSGPVTLLLAALTGLAIVVRRRL